MTTWRDTPPESWEIEEHAATHPRWVNLTTQDFNDPVGGLWMVFDPETHDAVFVEFNVLPDRGVYWWAVDIHARHAEGDLDWLTRGRPLRFRPVTADYEPCAWPVVVDVEAVSTAKPRGDA